MNANKEGGQTYDGDCQVLQAAFPILPLRTMYESKVLRASSSSGTYGQD
jgi:hypothetical protein